uniref:Uncharacterized protein n=1 Tax=Picea sitchensis TaxID=3332 RepID=A0A6B9XWI0_PICSI|nr:hypothetical protein Q903MT_gene5610 [Picea sitchensis]
MLSRLVGTYMVGSCEGPSGILQLHGVDGFRLLRSLEFGRRLVQADQLLFLSCWLLGRDY